MAQRFPDEIIHGFDTLMTAISSFSLTRGAMSIPGLKIFNVSPRIKGMVLHAHNVEPPKE